MISVDSVVSISLSSRPIGWILILVPPKIICTLYNFNFLQFSSMQRRKRQNLRLFLRLTFVTQRKTFPSRLTDPIALHTYFDPLRKVEKLFEQHKLEAFILCVKNSVSQSNYIRHVLIFDSLMLWCLLSLKYQLYFMYDK